MESIKDVLDKMREHGARGPRTGQSFPVDEQCPHCAGKGFVVVVDPETQWPVRRPDPRTRKDVVTHTVPYAHDVVCSCRTSPTIPSATACGLGGTLEHRTLQGFDPSDLTGGLFAQIQGWCHSLPAVLTGDGRQLKGFVFTGRTGNGKTHLAAALLHETRQKGVRCRFVPEVDVLEEIKASYDADERAQTEQRILERLKSVPLLCLDDVGQSYVPGGASASGTPTWSSSLLYRVLTDRVSRERVTIITTNLTPDQFEHRLGSATASRLRGFFIVPFTGRDRR